MTDIYMKIENTHYFNAGKCKYIENGQEAKSLNPLGSWRRNIFLNIVNTHTHTHTHMHL